MSGSSRRRYVPSGLDVAAALFAIALSLGCVAKGLVYDASVAIAILLLLPILGLALRFAHAVHQKTLIVGGLLFLSVFAVLVAQWIGRDVVKITVAEFMAYRDVGEKIVSNASAFWQSVGHMLFLLMIFALALLVGSSESSARLFIHWLLISGIVAMTVTFFIATENGVPSSTRFSFRHGFVNPNNASAYLGIMLLLSLAQALRFFRSPTSSFQRNVMNAIDRLSIGGILKGVSLLYCVLLSLASLFMTGSRGGIAIALSCATVLCYLVVRKMQIPSHWRYAIVGGVVSVAVSICFWSFLNFGQVITNKIQTNGISANSRPDIILSVVPMIADHPLLGVGIGNFAGAFQQYRPKAVSSDGIIDKAHNSYLELAAEMGLPILLLVLLVGKWVGVQLYYGVKEREERFVTPAFGFSVWLLAVTFSLIDFPLQIPAILALFIAIMVICVSQADRQFGQPSESMSDAPTRRVRIRKRRSRTKAII